MSEYQADALRRLIERYAALRVEAAQYGRRPVPTSLQYRLDEARGHLDALISTITTTRSIAA